LTRIFRWVPPLVAVAGILTTAQLWRVLQQEEALAPMRSPLPSVVAASGFIVSILLGLTTHLLWTAWQQAADQARVNERLTAEVTQRKHAVETRRSTEERFELAIQGLSDALWDWLDVDREELWWSPRFYEILGYEPGEIEPSLSTFRDLLHPDDADRIFAAMRTHLETAEPLDIEFRLRSKHGTYRRVRTRGNVLRDASGRPKRMAGSIQDVTDHRQAREALKETEERFRSMADAAPVMIWVSDVHGQRTWFNKRWLEFTGRTMEQELGTGWLDGVHPEDVDRGVKAINAAHDARAPFRLEYRLRRRDGVYRSILGQGTPRFTESGEFAGYIGSCLDITDLTRAEERIRRIVESAPNAMVMVGRSGQIELVNTELERAFGYTREELIGQSVEILVPPRYRLQHPTYRKQFHSDPQARPMGKGRDLFGLRKDGREFPVEIGLNPIEMDDGVHVLAAVVDITERKRSETELRLYASRLKATNRELEGYVYTVSHDLKAPLVTFLGYLSYLRDDIAAGRSDRLEQFIHNMSNAACQMKTILDDLLEISRIGRMKDEPVVVDVKETVASIVVELQPQIAEKAATIQIQDDLPTILLDHTQVRQVFQNLLTNALKYGCTDPNPKITVGGETDNTHTHFFVADNGHGIPRQYHEKIFDLFQRLDKNTEGNGVGLAIVARVAEVNGGRAWVESEVGQGAKFWVSFPIKRSPEESGEYAVAPGANPQPVAQAPGPEPSTPRTGIAAPKPVHSQTA
jgi:PAS domain S-box-containing protein